MALTKLSAGNDQYWLLNDVPHQRGQFDVSAKIGQEVVEIYSLNTLKSLARGKYDEFSPDGITPYASTQALIDDLKTFFFRSVSGGGGGGVTSVNGDVGPAVLLDSGDIPNTSSIPGITTTNALNASWQEITDNSSTGVINGMELSIDVGGLTYSISSGAFQVIEDSAPNVINEKIYLGSTGNSLPSLATDTTYYVFIDKNDVLTYQETKPLPNDYKERALIGGLVVISGSIAFFSNLQMPVTNTAWRVKNLTNALGLINAEGNILGCTGNNLTIAKTAGYLYTYRNGVGADQGSWVDIDAFDSDLGDGFLLTKRDGITNASATVLDVANYDNNGTITAIGGGSNASANWFVFIFPLEVVVVYPQTFYNSLEEAEQNIARDAASLVIPNVYTTTGFSLGVFTANKNATNLNNPLEASYRNGSKFGEFVNGGTTSLTLNKYEGVSAALNGGVDLAGNTKYTEDITVTGAVIGDKVDVGLSDLLANDLTTANIRPTYYAWVVSANTVRVAISVSSFLSGNTDYKMWCRIVK